ncbi:response regulator [Pseudaminobacter soli (ex Li et al. 2025)]|uniref:DNA-binding response regulator n=1 Tax=Pseudaminobacter soli (ex Li et al. 2025) TaxID=1295366 RepID=A0A2P7RXH7_9HYPH|nr:response regulator transcription factor [Mesorhizobium soli]PSJ54935.1 DNA-binding response regulator [Mesorhizobium soli]
MTQSQQKRVFLVDDHPVVLAGVKSMVEAQRDLKVVGLAGEAESAMRGIEETDPHIAVVDVSLPGTNGVMLIERLRQRFPELAALALTVHEESAYVHQLLQAGARGFILKRSAAEELIHAIRSVLAGGIYIDPVMAAKILSTPKTPIASAESLSDREVSVIKLVAKGYSNKEVSAQLSLSVKTIETYRARAAEKLGLRTRAALVRYATLEGWMVE